jgi:group I intron endonuclease
MHYLYKLTNKNTNKCYVGFTSTTPKNRWYQHCSNAFKRNKKSKLYSSMRKHGKEAFILEEIYCGKDALQKENDYIISENAEYNMTPGGEANQLGRRWSHSEETKRKLRKPKPPRTKEHSAKIGESNKGRIPWNKGMKGVQSAWNKGIRDSGRSSFWEITKINGDVFTTKNLVLWCENNGYVTSTVKSRYYKTQLPYLDICHIKKMGQVIG